MALRIPQVHDGTGVLRPSALGLEVVVHTIGAPYRAACRAEPLQNRPEDVEMVNMLRSCGVGFEFALLGDQ
jgi:hypothetical protein